MVSTKNTVAKIFTHDNFFSLYTMVPYVVSFIHASLFKTSTGIERSFVQYTGQPWYRYRIYLNIFYIPTVQKSYGRYY
jgi:hypothetical protein